MEVWWRCRSAWARLGSPNYPDNSPVLGESPEVRLFALLNNLELFQFSVVFVPLPAVSEVVRSLECNGLAKRRRQETWHDGKE